MNNPNKKRLRRTMMFLNAQKPGLIKDPYIYKPDSIMLDLEDAVAENQKDAARFSLYHALKTINYRGCDSIRIPKTESAQDVKLVEREIAYAEKEFGRPEGSVLIMAAVESARGVMKALDICESSERLFGIALSGGDYTKDLQTHITGTGIELMGARQNLVIAARAAGVQCFVRFIQTLTTWKDSVRMWKPSILWDLTENPLSIPARSMSYTIFTHQSRKTLFLRKK